MDETFDETTAVELQAQFRKDGRWATIESWDVAERDDRAHDDAMTRAIETAKVYFKTRKARYRVRTVTTAVTFETDERTWA